MTQEELDQLMNNDSYEDVAVENGEKENGMVHQLSSVTVDSEKKATEIMAKLESVLTEIDATKVCVEKGEKEKSLIILDDVQNIVFDIMSVMQYQDIHRQKIERVINTMVKISSMMSDSLNGVTLPANMAPSAKHIDASDGTVVDDDEIAKLIQANNQ